MIDPPAPTHRPAATHPPAPPEAPVPPTPPRQAGRGPRRGGPGGGWGPAPWAAGLMGAGGTAG